MLCSTESMWDTGLWNILVSIDKNLITYMQDMSWIHPKYHAGQGPVLTQWTSIILIITG